MLCIIIEGHANLLEVKRQFNAIQKYPLGLYSISLKAERTAPEHIIISESTVQKVTGSPQKKQSPPTVITLVIFLKMVTIGTERQQRDRNPEHSIPTNNAFNGIHLKAVFKSKDGYSIIFNSLAASNRTTATTLIRQIEQKKLTNATLQYLLLTSSYYDRDI